MPNLEINNPPIRSLSSWKGLVGLREPFASGSHLLGALAGLFAVIYLVGSCDGSTEAVCAALIYGIALISVFLISGLFHGLHCSEAGITKLERLDYAAIYLFIAGTYTPVCLFVIGGSLGTWLLAGEWALAIIGVYLTLNRGPTHRNLQVVIFLIMGWAFTLALPSLDKALSPPLFNLLILGGLFYSVGAVIFACGLPQFFRNKLSAHDWWHVLVLLGSSAHYIMVLRIMSQSAPIAVS